jgi:plastocyanin
MKRNSLQLHAAGILICVFSLTACGPRTPNAAAETPFVPATSAQATRALAVPTNAPPALGYPEQTASAPVPTATPDSYPVDNAATATTDPNAGVPATATTAPPAATNTSAPPVFITYRDFEILPAQTTIKVGTTVNFIIESASGAFHQPYAGAAAPFIFEGPAQMGNGVSWPFAFNTAQTLTILCGYHSEMRATLVIEP